MPANKDKPIKTAKSSTKLKLKSNSSEIDKNKIKSKLSKDGESVGASKLNDRSHVSNGEMNKVKNIKSAIASAKPPLSAKVVIISILRP